MSSLVMLWGVLTDPPLVSVLESLRRIGSTTLLVNQSDYHRMDIELDTQSSSPGSLRLGQDRITLDLIDAAYLRPYDFRRLPEMKEHNHESLNWQHTVSIEDMIMSWSEITDAIVVNRPSDMSSNSSKPYQSMIIRSLGFRIPETLITTNPEAASEFWQVHGHVIYKSISGMRSIIRRLTDEHRERLSNVVNCPTQFQEYISGKDYRVHVVGNKIFACEIVSQADDYRYASTQGFDVKIVSQTLPNDVSEMCIKLAEKCKLKLAGIDLRLTPAGEWYCFEVNPSPGFTYYQEATGEKIADEIAQLLSSGMSSDWV